MYLQKVILGHFIYTVFLLPGNKASRRAGQMLSVHEVLISLFLKFFILGTFLKFTKIKLNFEVLLNVIHHVIVCTENFHQNVCTNPSFKNLIVYDQL